MTDEAPEQTSNEGGNTNGEETPVADEFKPITSQEELNRIIGERVKRAKPADYDDLRAKAEKLDKIEEANKTEQQKLSERLEQAERQAEALQTEALRFKVASKYGIGDEDVELFLTGSDEETLQKQAERLAARNEEAIRPRAPKPDPNQGRQSGGSTSTADQFAAAVSDLM